MPLLVAGGPAEDPGNCPELALAAGRQLLRVPEPQLGPRRFIRLRVLFFGAFCQGMLGESRAP